MSPGQLLNEGTRVKARRFVTFAFLAVAAITSGALLAQAPQAVGTWAPLQDLQTPLSNGASVALADGRTLIVGGMRADGTLSDAITIYDAVSDSLTPAGVLVAPRSGHTATLMKDGRVLIVGGVTEGGLISTDIEMFDPTTGTSMLVAQLAEPRRGHVAASLPDGTALVAGGATTDGVVLQSAAIFDPETNSVSPLSTSLQSPRVNASATTLLDGEVLIAGGSNGSSDLASAEIYDRYSRSFAMAQTQMSVARQGHSAVLLPHNGGVLIVGGTSNAGTDLFLPAVFPDPYSYGEGAFTATGAMAAPRAAAVAGPTSIEGFAFAASAGAHDAEVYRFATVKTDKDDYAPGELAVITGSGWEANEEVTLLFQEDPAVHDDYVLKVQADSAGNISWNQWAPERHDFGVRFYLTASGSKSRAQMTFTDAAADTSISVSCTPNSVASGSPTTCTTTVTNTANGAPGGSPQGSVDWSLTAGLTGTFSPTSCNLTQLTTNSSRCSVTFTPDGLTVTGKVKGTYNPSPADWKTGNDQFALTVTTTKTTPTITFSPAPTPTFGGGNFSVSATTTNTDSSALTYSVVSGPCALVSGSTFSSSGAGACVVQASGAATANFNAASNTQSVTIAKAASTTTTVGAGPFVYDGTTHAGGSGTVTGAGGLSTSATSLTYTGDQVNAGTYYVTAHYAGDANHTPSDGESVGIVIGKATSATTTVGDGPFTYDGTTHAGGSGSVTGAGTITGTATVTYTGDQVNAGTYYVTAHYAGDANHTPSDGAAVAIVINKANATVSVSGYTGVYDGQAHGATGSAKGVGGAVLSGLNLGASFTNVPGGTAHWIFTDATGNYNNASGDVAITISFGTCSAASGPGNVVLPPINSDGSSVYNRKGGSTIPVKFRVCDAAGRPISDKSVVFGNSTGTIQMLSAVRGTVTNALEDVVNDVPDVAFRWTGQEWIFNMATSNLTSGTTYDFRIVLTSGSIPFRIGIK